MPPQARRELYIFCDHPVAGVNWRTTRLVDEVPDVRVCGVCGIIPKRIVKLPCSHFLCDCCYAFTSERGSRQCPVDRKPFKEAECGSVNFPPKKAKRLKAYCWNETAGCNFVGVMEDLLHHYENDCAFHSVLCEPRGHTLLHKYAVMHYLSGCSTSVPSAGSEHSASQSATVTSGDSNASEERENALSRNVFQDGQLSALQNQMTELTKLVRKQEASLNEVISEQRLSARNLRDAMIDIISTTITACMPQQQNPGNFADDDAKSSALSLRSEKAVILRKLEHFANVTLSTLEELRQYMLQIKSRAVIARCEPMLPCRDRFRHFTRVPTMYPQSGAEIPSVSYYLTLQNADEIIFSEQQYQTFAEVTTWHMRDTYFVVTVRTSVDDGAEVLALEIEFNDLREGSQWLPAARSVTVLHPYGWSWVLREAVDTPCSCKRSLDKLHHAHRTFVTDINYLRKGFCRDGMMKFQIELIT
ncbi:hypothetical protein HPB52_011254 [Rhipicephalus sanguineus]|uniref:RING-type domain-containing protein n=1 Tax=Rhipicephalus sanguineus TaxID=34632 RepID=A0A9D4PJ85_RHISA|nr:hypothetical protein HPB52_011254 [Rhipicephalus sanguineus]